MTARLIQPPEYRSARWLEWRRGGLGASDLPAIVGVDTFKGEYALWCEKRATDTPEDNPSDVMRFGSFVEAYGIQRWQEQTALEVVTGETFGDDRWPNLWATLDGRSPDERVGLEVKYSTRSEELPEKWVIQALAQIGLADLDAVDLVRIDSRGTPTIHRVERDDTRIKALLDLGQSWFERYVIGGEEPPIDGSPEARRALDRMVGTEQREADERQLELLEELRRTRKALERLQAADERLVRDIKASMAGAGVLVAPAARVTWAPVKGRKTTDWKAIAAAYRLLLTAQVEHVEVPEWLEKMGGARLQPEMFDAIESVHTNEGDPTTRFAVKFDEEEKT
jgi:predicted phage-related endonuclease